MACLTWKECNQSRESIISSVQYRKIGASALIDSPLSKQVQVLPRDGAELVLSAHHQGMLTSPGTRKDSSDAENSWTVLPLKQNDFIWDRGRQMKLLQGKNVFSTWNDYFSLPPNDYWRVLHLHLYKIQTDVVFSTTAAEFKQAITGHTYTVHETMTARTGEVRQYTPSSTRKWRSKALNRFCKLFTTWK